MLPLHLAATQAHKILIDSAAPSKHCELLTFSRFSIGRKVFLVIPGVGVTEHPVMQFADNIGDDVAANLSLIAGIVHECCSDIAVCIRISYLGNPSAKIEWHHHTPDSGRLLGATDARLACGIMSAQAKWLLKRRKVESCKEEAT